MNTECGLLSLININKLNIANLQLLWNSFKKLQHRGQDSCGISYYEGKCIQTFKKLGVIDDFPSILQDKEINNNVAVCHNRYTTSGNKIRGNLLNEAQPMNIKTILGDISLAHNGNISTNLLKKLIKENKSEINTDNLSDSKLLSHLVDILINKNFSILELGKYILNKIQGVYNLILMHNNKLYIIRDRYGIRPLILGEGNFSETYDKKEINNVRFTNKNSVIVSSESCVFTNLNISILRDVCPGEFIELAIDNNKKINIRTLYKYGENNDSVFSSHCLFEYIYFLRENTLADNINVKEFREKCGEKLAEYDIDKFDNTYLVCGAPNTGIPASINYAKKLGLYYEQIIKKNPNYGRSFIEPDNTTRLKVCNEKLIIQANKNYSKIIIIDDSLVRGNTIKTLIKKLRLTHIKEVHIRITSPPVISPCYYGIDIPTYTELEAYNKNINEINQDIGSDSLKYLSLEDIQSMYINTNFCTNCFTDKYHIEW